MSNTKLPVEIKDLFKFKFLSNTKFNKSKTHLAFVVSNANERENKYDSNIWIYDVNTKEIKQLTNGNNELNYFWYSDTKIVFNRSNKNKTDGNYPKSIFHIIDINGGEAVKFFELNLTISSIDKIDDNNFVFITFKDLAKKNLDKLDEKTKEKELKEIEVNKNLYVTDKSPIWMNGVGFLESKIFQIGVFNKQENKIKFLSCKHQMVNSFTVYKNRYVLFTANNYESVLTWTNALFLYDLNTQQSRCVYPINNGSVHYANFIDNQTIVAVINNGEKYGWYTNPHFYFYNLKDLTLIRKVSNDSSTWNAVLSDCRYGQMQTKLVHNNKLFFIDTNNESSNIKCLDLQGNISKVTNISGSIDSFDVDTNNNLYYVAFQNLKLQELYVFENNKSFQLTDFNDKYFNEKAIDQIEKIEIKNNHGNLTGFIIKPINFDASKKYPAILQIHGGPKMTFGEIFYHEIQLFSSQGYFVFFCNPFGSDGKGNEFADLRQKYGTIDYQDIMNFTNTVIEKYKNNIDINNIGVIGGSYGGLMVNWIIGHTNFFKTAVSLRSVSNWMTMLISDIGHIFPDDQCGGNIWNSDPNKILEMSPIYYANKVKTPTMFIQSEYDLRCPYNEALQMYSAVRMFGTYAKFVMFKDENHDFSRNGKPINRIKRLNLIFDWFNKYLKIQK